MSLAATLAADGSRPASFFPSIKCSQCGHDINVDAMSDHVCSGPPRAAQYQQQPPYPHNPQPSQSSQSSEGGKPRSFSNPFALRQWNANGRPAQSSPLSQGQGPPGNMMNRPPPPGQYPPAQYPPGPPPPGQHPPGPHGAGVHPPGPPPPGMSNAVLGPPPRATRAALPRINPDAANKPFMGQAANPASPRSPSSRMPFTSNSGPPGRPPNNESAKQPPNMRSQPSPMPRSPMPRLWDLRPPSEEMSANLDCAFPPFPAPFASNSRPGSRNGSDRGGSPASSSRRDGKESDPKSPPPVNGGAFNRSNTPSTIKASSSASLRRPSNESKRSQERMPLDRRRPSLPKSPILEMPPRPPSAASSTYSDGPPAPPAGSQSTPNGPALVRMPSFPKADSPPMLPRDLDIGNNGPPSRPARPTESVLSPQLLNQLDVAPPAEIPAALAIAGPPIPAKSEQRNLPDERTDLGLARMDSAPAFGGGPSMRPPMLDGSRSEPAHLPQMRSASPSPRPSHEHAHDGEVLPPPNALQRRPSQHAPSESGSSVFSVANSTSNSNSTHDGPSVVGSAASSVDTSSPLGYNVMRYSDEQGTKGLGLNIKENNGQAQSMDGMIAENIPMKQPPPKFTEPLPSPPQFGNTNWPLESPMDPALNRGNIKIVDPANSPNGQGPSGADSSNGFPRSPPNGLMASPDSLSSNGFAPYQPGSQQPPPPGRVQSPPMPQMRPRSRTGSSPTTPMGGPMGPGGPRSRTPQGTRRPPMRQQTMPLPPPPQGGPGGMRPPMSPRMASAGPSPGPRMGPPGGPGGQRMGPPPGGRMGGPPGPGGPQDRPVYIPPRSQSLSSRSSSRRPTMASAAGDEPPLPLPIAPTSPPKNDNSNSQSNNTPPIAAFHPVTGRPLCRGCGEQIEGKSVKAADGGLTGRWHKGCFVCRSCRQPFTTADFYVLDNHPYCEQHYHEENGSLCRGCHRGIEGPYLETAGTNPPGAAGVGGKQKFHPRCFTCADCRTVLDADYFEISGSVYCERHAMARMRGQARAASGGMVSTGFGLSPPGSAGGGNLAGAGGFGPAGASGLGPGGAGVGKPLMMPSNLRAEKRTTRLMMMES